HRPLARIRAALTRRGDVQRLPRMAGIALSDLNGGETRRGARLVVPNTKHFRYAAGVKRPPNFGGAGNALEQTSLIDRFVLRRAADDWIIAIKDRLDVDIGPRLRVVGIVAHPFAERTFRHYLTRHRLAFNRDLAVGRDRETGIRSADHVDRLAAQAASEIVF